MDLRLCHNHTQMWKRFWGACGISEGWSCQGSIISSVLSHHNKNLKRWTLKPSARHSSQTDHVNSSQTDQFYLEKKENTSSRLEGMPTQKTWREREGVCAQVGERETSGSLAPLLYVFSSPRPALCKLGWPGVLFVPTEALTPVLGPSFDLFSQAFPFVVF